MAGRDRRHGRRVGGARQVRVGHRTDPAEVGQVGQLPHRQRRLLELDAAVVDGWRVERGQRHRGGGRFPRVRVDEGAGQVLDLLGPLLAADE